ncbi:MAG: hypothetical protein RLZZ04_4366 [Cyanobacteriota bacterium]|jgi:D-alanyl-D-alanine carboxypeptidase
MLDTDFDPNVISNQNATNFDQNLNLEAYFPSTVDANSNSMMPTTSGTAQNDLIEISQPDLNTYGLEGDDLIFGSSGKDVLFGNDGNDIIQAKEGDDLLNGGGGIDYLTGNKGNDSLVGGSDNDLLVGDVGNDRLLGESGDDYLTGGKGNDYLDGGAGLDRVQGNEGKDILVDEDGGDRLTGGEDADEFRIGSPQSNATSKIADFEISTDQLKVLRIGASFGNLRIEDSEDGAAIFDGEQNIGILEGVKADALSKNDFIFADPKLAETFQTEISKGTEDTNLPGVSATVIAPDGTSWQGTQGYANQEAGQFLKPDDLFYTASTTKAFTATTILQLAQENKLSLDDPLEKWLPDDASQITNGDRITVRQLLNHTSGIPDYGNDTLNIINDPAIRAKLIDDPELSTATRDVIVSLSDKPVTSLEDPAIQSILGDDTLATKLELNNPLTQTSTTPNEKIATVYGQPSLSEPGSDFNYSNVNFLLLGKIIETATDSNVSEQFRERIIEPLGMKNTFYGSQEQIPGGYVRSYKDINGDGKPDDISNEFDSSYILSGADGGIVSTPTDLSKFARGLFKGELLAPDTLKQMVSGGKEGSDYGLGLTVNNDSQLGQIWGHPGGVTGWDAQMSYFPEQDTTVAVTRNGQAPNVPLSLDLANPLADKVSASSNSTNSLRTPSLEKP